MPDTPDSHTRTVHDHKRRLIDAGRRVLRVAIPFCVTAGLAGWLFHKVDLRQIKAILDDDCHFGFIVLMMFITMMSHIVRGIRWGIQLRAVGIPRLSVIGYSVSIFGAYALNLIVPYLGEAWRCIYISRRENVKLATVVGTDIGDRGSDAVVVASLVLLALIVAHPKLTEFICHYQMGRDIADIFSQWPIWVTVIALVAAMLWGYRKLNNIRFFAGVNRSLTRIWGGFKVLFTMKGRAAYLWLTLAIWVCYFSETYSCFWAFNFTRALIYEPGNACGLLPGLIVFVFGSMSMAVPSNGGLGPWNMAVMYALMLYGLEQTDAAAYTVIVWSFQSSMLVALGIFSAIYIYVTGRRHRPRSSQLCNSRV